MEFLDKYAQCIDEETNRTTQSKVVLQERGRRYCLNNPNRGGAITKVEVENCVINDRGEKGCEAILIAEKEKENKGFYIELKGISVGDALKQIENSLNRTLADLKNMILFGRIIPSAYKRNKFLETHEQRLILKFKKLGGNFIIRENYEDTI